MTKRQIIVIALALLVAVAALVSIPFLQREADQRDRARGAAAGLALIHRFDCTYGIPFRDLLASSAYASAVASGNSFEQAKHQHGDQRASTLRLAQTQQVRAADLLRQFGEVRPLAPGNLPCPPKRSK